MPNRKKVLFFFLIFFAILLRITACFKYGFIDEYPIFGNIHNFVRNATLVPTHFNYPTLFSYLATIPTGIEAIVLYLQGTLQAPQNISALTSLDSIIPLLAARFTSVFFGLAAILLLFRIGVKFYDINTGIITAALLTFSLLHIKYSSFALPEATMVFFATCSIYFSLTALRTRSLRDFVLAGSFVGLTATTKYNGVLMILLPLSVHMVLVYNEGKLLSPRAWINKKITLCVLAAICLFIVGSPGWVTNTSSFWQGFIFERSHMARGHLGAFGMPYLQHLNLFWQEETTIAIFFAVGLIYAIKRRTTQDIALVVLILASFLYIGSWQKKSLRYLIFLYPALTLLSARLLSEVLLKLKNSKVRLARFSSLLIIISVFIWPARNAVVYAHQQTLTDSRHIAYKWIQENIPDGSAIVMDWAYLPKLLTEKRKNSLLSGQQQPFYETYLKNVNTYKLIPIVFSPNWLRKTKANYLLTSSSCYDRFFNKAPPPRHNPLFFRYRNRKATYTALLKNEKEYGWHLYKRFYTGKGPLILVYKRPP